MNRAEIEVQLDRFLMAYYAAKIHVEVHQGGTPQEILDWIDRAENAIELTKRLYPWYYERYNGRH